MAISHCIACRSNAWSVINEWRGYRIALCAQCGCNFTVNPDYEMGRYIRVYESASEGEPPLPEGLEYLYAAPARRLHLEALAYCRPFPHLTPVEKLALKELKACAPKASLIMDVGCGTGRFLRALERTSFQSVGVEVSDELVDCLNCSGLKAIRGSVPDLPWNGPDPFAIAFFEVLEHLPEPELTIRPLKERFPRTRIIASVPSLIRASMLLGQDTAISDYPPHHFLRWTPKALEAFFKRLGYSTVKVLVPPPVGSELMPNSSRCLSKFVRFGQGTSSPGVNCETGMFGMVMKRLAATAFLWAHKGYQVAMDIAGSPKAHYLKKNGASSASMLVVATPQNSES